MSLERGRVCAECGARNKPRWEFCVRCGEALTDAPVTAETTAPEADGAPTEIAWGAWALSALVLAGAVAAYVFLSRGPGEPPAPDLFAVASPVPPPSAVPPPPKKDAAAEGERRLAMGDVQGALPLLEEALSQNSGDVRLLKLYAQALRRAGRTDAAVSELRKVVVLSADDGAARLELARLLDKLGRAPEAAEAYASLLQMSPRNAEGLALLAGLHKRQGRHAEAVPLLRRLTELKPDDLNAQLDLAFALEKSGDEPAAIAEYSKVLEAAPTASIARGLLAEALARQGDTTKAEALFREGIALQPTVPALHRSLGNLLERKGSYAEAAIAYREYARLAPNSSDAKALVERADSLEKRATASS